jgi:prephenate dehydrogenase
LFTCLLRRDGPVVPVDIRPGGVVGDACAPNRPVRTALAGTDLAVLALPERDALRAVDVVAACLRPGAAIVDTLSVKHRIGPKLADAARRHRLEALSLNPMFAPDLGFEGWPVAVVDVVPGPVGARLRHLLAAAGARPVTVSARRHDELTAALQATTHAAIVGFGSALRRLDVPLDALLNLAPPPHRLLLALLARICSSSPEVYHNIQTANPNAARARAALTEALGHLDDLTRADAADFAASIGELANWLRPHREALAALCARVFADLL